MFNFRTTLILSALSLLSTETFAQNLIVAGVPKGSYVGRMKGAEKGKAHLITTPIAGCNGCFMAVLMKRKHGGLFGLGKIDRTIEVYKALPIGIPVYTNQSPGQNWNTNNITAAQYSLTPIRITPEGEIAPLNFTNPTNEWGKTGVGAAADPSKRLVIESNAGATDVRFSLGDAGSTNKDAFKTAILFNGNESPFAEDEEDAGRIRELGNNRLFGTFSMFGTSQEDLVTRFATVTSFGARGEIDQSGTFQVEEKAPGLFTYTQLGLYEDGEKLADHPAKTIVFIELGSRKRAFMISPNNANLVQEYKVKEN